jgi:NADH-quinone oxidoreductase subunit J
VSFEVILFWAFAVGTVGSALVVLWAKNPINAAMSLVGTFFFLAGIYVLLWAHTIAALQVLVYAGAVMVLFLFVIMLLNLAETGGARSPVTVSRVLGGAATLGLGGVMATVMLRLDGGVKALTDEQVARFGTIERMGELIYGLYLFPFEAVSLLLLAAIVGAVVVAKSRI